MNMRIKTNSKDIEKGDVFVALKGINSDGHDYINDAIDNGASYIICERGSYEVPFMIVPSTHNFINDYVTWMTKEVDGVQKMDKQVRAIFWRYIPFNQQKKEELKKRSVVYQELYQRDINRSMSDGY